DYPWAGHRGPGPKIFKWAHDCTAPADCPKPPLCQPTEGSCGPVCGTSGCKPKGSLSECTDKRFIDPCTGKFDYEKYLAELRAKHGDCGPECAGNVPPAGPEQIQTMPAPNAKNGVDQSKYPILSSTTGKPIGVTAKTEDKMMTPPVTTLPPVNDKNKAKTATADANSDSLWKKWFGDDKAAAGTQSASKDHPASTT